MGELVAKCHVEDHEALGIARAIIERLQKDLLVAEQERDHLRSRFRKALDRIDTLEAALLNHHMQQVWMDGKPCLACGMAEKEAFAALEGNERQPNIPPLSVREAKLRVKPDDAT